MHTYMYVGCSDRECHLVSQGMNIEFRFAGWFEKIRGDDASIHNTYMACTTIGKIARSNCRKFLVRTPIVGHRYSEDDQGLVLLEEVNVYVGEILRCDGVGKRQWKTVGQSEGSDDSPAAPETQFLKCIDPSKNKLCISLGHPGKFSPIYDLNAGDDNPSNCVYQLGDLLKEESSFPMSVRLAFGWMPKLPIIPRKFQDIMQFTWNYG